MTPLELVQLPALMALTSGSEDIVVALLDGSVALDHPDLLSERIHDILGEMGGKCSQANSTAGQHGTFVAGILSARRGSAAPTICPGCSLLVRPIFPKKMAQGELLPQATAQQLAVAIGDCIKAGARVLNLSAAMSPSLTRDERELRDALDDAGRRELGAPGEEVTSLSPQGQPRTLAGTSSATAFVTGPIALLWSMFPGATAIDIKRAVTTIGPRRRSSVVPPCSTPGTFHSRAYRTFREYHNGKTG